MSPSMSCHVMSCPSYDCVDDLCCCRVNVLLLAGNHRRKFNLFPLSACCKGRPSGGPRGGGRHRASFDIHEQPLPGGCPRGSLTSTTPAAPHGSQRRCSCRGPQPTPRPIPPAAATADTAAHVIQGIGVTYRGHFRISPIPSLPPTPNLKQNTHRERQNHGPEDPRRNLRAHRKTIEW